MIKDSWLYMGFGNLFILYSLAVIYGYNFPDILYYMFLFLGIVANMLGVYMLFNQGEK